MSPDRMQAVLGTPSPGRRGGRRPSAVGPAAHATSAPMRVLAIAGSLRVDIGGPAWSVVNGAVARGAAGMDVELWYVRSADDPDERDQANLSLLRERGIAYRAFPQSLPGRSWAWRYAVSLDLCARLAREFGHFDVVHLHSAWLAGSLWAVLLRLLPRGGRRPLLVLSPHESLTDFDIAQSRGLPTRALKTLLRRLYLRAADAIVVSSGLEEGQTVAGAAGRRARAGVFVVPHAIPDGDDGPAAKARPAAPPAAEGALRLGFLGRFHGKKNLPLILRALARLPAGYTLTVAGGGPPEEEAAVAGLIGELGIGSRVRLLGLVDGPRKREFWRTIDVLVMPSDFECFGMSAAEALAQGKPVVLSPGVGVASVVRGEAVVVTSDPGPEGLADAIRAVPTGAAALAALSAAARDTADAAFSPASHGRRLRDLYLTLATRSQR